MFGRVAFRRSLEVGLGERHVRRLRLAHRPLERGTAATVVDGGPEPLELVVLWVPQAGPKHKSVERKLNVVHGWSLTERDGDVLLERRSGPEAGVVVRTEE